MITTIFSDDGVLRQERKKEKQEQRISKLGKFLRHVGTGAAVVAITTAFPIPIPSGELPHFPLHANFIKMPRPPPINYVTEIPISEYYSQEKGWDISSLKLAEVNYFNFARNYPNEMVTNGIPNAMWIFMPVIKEVAKSKRVDPYDLASLTISESFDYKYSIGKKGELGLTQVYLEKHKEILRNVDIRNIFEPKVNLDSGATVLRYYLDMFGGDYRKAIAAYNAGPEEVILNSVPKVTRNYVNRILENANRIRELDRVRKSTS